MLLTAQTASDIINQGVADSPSPSVASHHAALGAGDGASAIIVHQGRSLSDRTVSHILQDTITAKFINQSFIAIYIILCFTYDKQRQCLHFSIT